MRCAEEMTHPDRVPIMFHQLLELWPLILFRLRRFINLLAYLFTYVVVSFAAIFALLTEVSSTQLW